ncbi:DNA repair protein RAD51 homolog 3 [Parasteatoda tepidariorum]|uniref:DNA repair protein RAD51 homolog 3 n=1 Tax=Parasteatoda tepidariorum TaxID=114398 RepID=UPI00077FC492|nr:DNA repair protein RAD51 homolog 3 isoform X1 [Parasteatoda tepidariorum]XP_042911453.1 DNA repair protein RAD51 homolog 3 isoform X2 [Parasteatoda tepidariorum]XP_042911454.1 DNA repair protein RAD51 homolog 3 isoform X1 [Parasteatoda tepidariorum]XP_042911455.1 DNA repair protein RAD51 homolog 3 isoform X1 [Parasteatoda tepidariorum]
MSRDLSTFPISSSVRFKLCNSGFLTVEDLSNFKPNELAKEAGLSAEEALEVLDLVFPPVSSLSVTHSLGLSAFEVLKVEKSLNPITTSCTALDRILKGGIPLKKVTEICGSPGSGKTQLCMQLCTNVQIPKSISGLSGEAFYIDTEGSFIVQRLVQIANGSINKYKAGLEGPDILEFSIDKILQKVHYYSCKSYTEVIAQINVLHKFLEQHKNVSLIVVDSIAFHFRYGFDGSYSLRNRLLNGIMQSLVKIANDFNVAVVLTNQMTTKVKDDGTSQLIPALGESWGHACTTRLLLSWTENERRAHILKSNALEEAEAMFAITTDGIRDVVLAQVQM